MDTHKRVEAPSEASMSSLCPTFSLIFVSLFFSFFFAFFFLLSHAHKELKCVSLNIMGAGLYPKSLIKVLACILLWGKQGMMVWEEVKYIL